MDSNLPPSFTDKLFWPLFAITIVVLFAGAGIIFSITAKQVHVPPVGSQGEPAKPAAGGNLPFPFVDSNKLIKMNHPDSGPRVIVLNTGERIECSKVADPGTGYWSYVRSKDGAASTVKKSDVKEIVPPLEREAAP